MVGNWACILALYTKKGRTKMESLCCSKMQALFSPWSDKQKKFSSSVLKKLINKVLVLNDGFIPTVQPHWLHFARAITRPWVGLLGRLWYILVEEDLTIFLRYNGPISVEGKVLKNQVENWKIAFLAFFVNLVKCPNLLNKVPFFYFLTHHGDGGDWYRHTWAQ